MLFLNSRARNNTVGGTAAGDQSYTRKIGHSCIICGCISIITGLILIVIGVISEVKKTTFIGIGIISLGAGFFLVTLICFYGKLDICYNNWAYRSRVAPETVEKTRPTPIGRASNTHIDGLSIVRQKQPSLVPIETHAPVTVMSEVEIHKLVVSPRPPTSPITYNSANVP